MTAGLLGLLVMVAVYFAVSSTLSLLVAAALPRLEAALRPWPAQRRTTGLLALALAPAAGGVLATLGVALPAWLRHEPQGGGEWPGPALVVLAEAGFSLAALRLGVALRDHLRTSRLVYSWTSAGQELPGLPLPATRVLCDFPLAAVFGIWRPQLLLSDSLLRGLTLAETRAVVEHELAHAGVRENLRRFVLRASPDLLALLPAGARLRSLFDEASEAAADHVASARVSPLLLAQALLKTASLVPAGHRLELSFAGFHREGGIAARVEALLQSGGGQASDRDRGPRALGVAVALLVGLLFALGQTSGPAAHRVLEDLVHLFA
jgi:Zn-dependent protease with chaperone function